MSRLTSLLRAAFVGSTAALFSGCPSQCDDPVSVAVTDPSLGELEASITWLQTGTQTRLFITAVAADSATAESCNPAVEVAYTLVSADGAIDETIYAVESVVPDGTFRYPLLLWLDERRPLAAGVAPEIPDLIDRLPILTLYLERTDSGYADGEIHVRTERDDLTLASVSSVRAL